MPRWPIWRLTIAAAAVAWSVGALSMPVASVAPAATDLDLLMQRVLAHRDDNWKKLQQYILDEQESVEIRAAGGAAVWGDHRDYTWFIRDGYFVRSPLKANGVAISDAARRRYEADFLERAEQRDRRQNGDLGQPSAGDAQPNDLDGLIRQTREPQFISSAYFLRFRFDEGQYALVGRERLEGRDVLKIEYYPANLFPQDRRGPGRLGSNPVDTATRRLLNKVAIVTLWIDPTSDQILKYTFDNVDLDFLPAAWLVRIDSAHASMTMGQPFPDVWLPGGIDLDIGLALALGDFNIRYQVAYHDYRRAEVNSTLHVPQDR